MHSIFKKPHDNESLLSHRDGGKSISISRLVLAVPEILHFDESFIQKSFYAAYGFPKICARGF